MKQNFDLERPGRLDRPSRRLDRPFLKTCPRVKPQLPIARSPESLHGLQRNFGNSWVTSWATSTSKESTESLTIKRNRRNCLPRSRTRPTRKSIKSSPIQGRFGGKVTSQRGTRSSYVTPTKNPKKSSSKTPPTQSSKNHYKEGREKHFTT
jgi:hypothetical protein